MNTSIEDFVEKFPTKEMTFLEICKEFLELIEEEQVNKFEKAGALIGESIMKDKLIHVIGTGGHTNLPAYDMFYRAGGFVPINYIIPIGAHYGAASATHGMRIERTPGYMRQVIDYYRVKKDDLAIVFNNIGINAGCIDAALECKEREATVIGVGGSPWQKTIPKDHYTRHPSKKNLMEIADLFIDDCNPVGDTVMRIDDFDRPFAPITTITDGYIVRRMEIEAVKYLLDNDFTPPMWMSANVVGGDEANEEYIDKYYNRVKHL